MRYQGIQYGRSTAVFAPEYQVYPADIGYHNSTDFYGYIYHGKSVRSKILPGTRVDYFVYILFHHTLVPGKQHTAVHVMDFGAVVDGVFRSGGAWRPLSDVLFPRCVILSSESCYVRLYILYTPRTRVFEEHPQI